MKTNLIILIMTLASLLARAQIVTIPDANLKNALVNSPIADLGNGINEIADTNGDGEIQITEAEAVLGLLLVELSIADLEGLQYFVNLEVLNCSQNYLIASIPTTFMPNLTYLHCASNNITNLNVTQNPFLEILILEVNLLTSIDVTQNSVLKELYLSSCQLSDLNITQNIFLEKLYCNGNQLVNLNIQNNNNSIIIRMLATNNPNLTCIQVDNVEYANNQPNWHKDETAIYSEDCNLSINENDLQQIINVYPNPVKNILSIENNKNIGIEKITVYNILGNTVLIKKNNFNQLNLSVLNSGILFVKIETKNGTITKKIIKE